jgi:hypothetical protein
MQQYLKKAAELRMTTPQSKLITWKTLKLSVKNRIQRMSSYAH